jgi:hypothetical protein
VNTAGRVGGILALGLGFSGAGLAHIAPSVADASDVRIVSSFVAPGRPVPAECRDEAHVFAGSLVRYPRPVSWHWVLICDEAGWRRFLRLSGRREDEAIYASADLESRTTYLRGPKLLYPGDFGVRPDEIVAHELTHIWLNSSDELAARRLAGSSPEPSREQKSDGVERHCPAN